ncbi:peptidoglycan hydrolase-like protein with peptidoglycan-binding domain [Arthrobacter woluwensis]|uniref:peptidoglycan-binding domain-containing protein n=1 Tax=Arthrobacter woluwensis TaxID=156980 RepID=UPI002780A9B4|nr:peptidoglycan-binding domain-containing protein [Arthrobacter woluwensis]MDQ0708400.1 peptidoglycan hydrolase-like protein with peptidoglycan-binding domain [Arthrobacter woluwensis]
MMRIKKGLAAGAAAFALAGLMSASPVGAANAYSGTTGKGCTAYQYSRGGYATCVGHIQRMLNGIRAAYGSQYGGYSLTVDNSFGANTETNVRRFQQWTYLTSDGIVGAKTWNQLCSYAGQVNFSYSDVGAAKNAAWQAAYDAGCYVEKKSSTPPYYTTISKY